MKIHIKFKGGKGSGHFGHEGRPGKVGGSMPGSDGSGLATSVDDLTATEKRSLKEVASVLVSNPQHTFANMKNILYTVSRHSPSSGRRIIRLIDRDGEFGNIAAAISEIYMTKSYGYPSDYKFEDMIKFLDDYGAKKG